MFLIINNLYLIIIMTEKSKSKKTSTSTTHVTQTKSSKHPVVNNNISINVQSSSSAKIPAPKKPKPVRRKKTDNKKRKLIQAIREALLKFQQVKQLAQEKKIELPASIGDTPLEASKVDTTEELEQLLQSIIQKTSQATQIIEAGGMHKRQVQPNPFLTGIGYSTDVRLPIQPYQTYPSAQQPTIQPSAPIVPQQTPTILPSSSGGGTVVRPAAGTVSKTAENIKRAKFLLNRLEALKTELGKKLKDDLAAGVISKATYDKALDALAKKVAEGKEAGKKGEASIVGEETMKEWEGIKQKGRDYEARLKAESLSPQILRSKLGDLKQLQRDNKEALDRFGKTYSDTLVQHPEVFPEITTIHTLFTDNVETQLAAEGGFMQMVIIDDEKGAREFVIFQDRLVETTDWLEAAEKHPLVYTLKDSTRIRQIGEDAITELGGGNHKEGRAKLFRHTQSPESLKARNAYNTWVERLGKIQAIIREQHGTFHPPPPMAGGVPPQGGKPAPPAPHFIADPHIAAALSELRTYVSDVPLTESGQPISLALLKTKIKVDMLTLTGINQATLKLINKQHTTGSVEHQEDIKDLIDEWLMTDEGRPYQKFYEMTGTPVEGKSIHSVLPEMVAAPPEGGKATTPFYQPMSSVDFPLGQIGQPRPPLSKRDIPFERKPPT
jgi:hypothetical protein